MITRQQLSSVFYIYSNASVAVMMGIAALLELTCGVALHIAYPSDLAYFGYAASALFTLITISLVLNVYRDAKRHNII